MRRIVAQKGRRSLDPKSQNVLVTGGAGFIGSALSRLLADRYGQWVAFDSMHPQVHADGARPDALHPSADLVVGDVVSAEDWDRLLADFTPDIVIHLAAETGTSQSLNEASRHARVNVVGTTEMTDAFVRHGVRPELILLASSRAVYGEGEWALADGARLTPGLRSHAQLEKGEWDFPGATPLPSEAATTVPHPVNIYGATKLAQENLLEAWCGSHDVRRAVLRLQNVYGPGQSLINAYTGIVSLFSQWAEQKKVIDVYEDGAIVRDFVYIDDVVSAFAAVLGGAGDSRTYDVGSGDATSLLDMAQTIARFHGAPEPRITGQYRDGDVRHAACSVERTIADLGWRPEWPLDRGVAALQEWIAGQELRIRPA
jgi:dTDP-L-rhamnose 4-epimerase